ncbi:MAG: MCE family protein [bacterium]|nr:MCE family protein [bacterium]
MSRQAQVGAFALVALLLLFGVFYVITDFGTRHTGYRTGIHFRSAAGLHSGALVYFSGVTVGTVDSIVLLPDNSVDVILAVNRDVNIPRDSRFLIQAPLTGDPNLLIVPPVMKTGPNGEVPQLAMLEKRVLPVEDQPNGTNSATIADLLEEGQGEIRRLDAMLAQLQVSEPKLLATMQQTLDNANAVTGEARSTLASMSSELQTSLAQASANIVAMTGTLNETTQFNSKRITSILAQFDQTSQALNQSVASLKSMATDPTLKSNILGTAQNIADTTKNIADITHDLQSLTGDPQTQAQLKNTVANLNATMQRANSLLGALGGTSSVYGVDPDARPYPTGSAVPSGQPSGAGAPSSGATPSPAQRRLDINRRLASVASNLIAIQVRISGLSREQHCCLDALYGADRGPQTDLNALIFPHGSTSLFVGANDIGYHTTTNLAVLERMSANVRLGGGILYSQLGVMGRYDDRLFGIDGRLYDPRRPQLDLYGNIHLGKGLDLFAGERALNHQERRFTYGIQAQFP